MIIVNKLSRYVYTADSYQIVDENGETNLIKCFVGDVFYYIENSNIYEFYNEVQIPNDIKSYNYIDGEFIEISDGRPPIN